MRPIAPGSRWNCRSHSAALEHDDRRGIPRRERAADERGDAEQRKELPIRDDALTRSEPSPVSSSLVVSSYPEKRSNDDALRAERLQVAERDRAGAARLVNLGDLHEPIGRGKRQWPQQHGVDDAEDGRRRAGGERERRDRHDRESRTAQERARGEPEGRARALSSQSQPQTSRDSSRRRSAFPKRDGRAIIARCASISRRSSSS